MEARGSVNTVSVPVRRARLVASLREQGITDERVLAAVAAIPREKFVPREFFSQAYEDYALEIGEGQTISQPSVVAKLVQLAAVEASDRVLEIGTGSGYLTAVLAQLARFVFSVERIPKLAQSAGHRLAELGFSNVTVQVMDGSLGWRAHAPYDVIVVSAAAPSVPRALTDQLAQGGRLVLPVGNRRVQQLLLVQRRGQELLESQHGSASFVPLVGCEGFREAP
jgi:protein-L-isoaspartate(D-aspartate) O-methyltransferase